jgi:hypothetical protein
MAIRITRIDDIDGSDGAEAIAFELDHKAYEIDLCVRNRIRFFRLIEPFIERARVLDEGEEAEKVTTIARPVSRHRTDPPVYSSDLGDSATNREPGALDLIELARRVEG